jgi:CrcB protein
MLAVAAGGFLGSILRYFAGEWIKLDNGFPIGTCAVNLSGSFMLALLLTLTTTRVTMNPLVRLAIGTGLIGSFTTFSTFSMETLLLLHNQQWIMAFVYFATTIAGSCLLSYGGYSIATLISKSTKGAAS